MESSRGRTYVKESVLVVMLRSQAGLIILRPTKLRVHNRT
jgi:hypothetical protein